MAGIYIHIPFCKKACHYCNFHFSTQLKSLQATIDAIAKELSLQKSYLKGQLIETIYFGGGTPSLLSDLQIDTLLTTIYKHYKLATDIEITLEANPDDITITRLPVWRKLGINRISLGVQSFNEDELIWMNRAHHARQSIESIQHIQLFFENYSIDLIYGSPLLSDGSWEKTLQSVQEMAVPHLSCYALTVEPKTALDKMIQQQKKLPVNNEHQAKQFETLMLFAEKTGYLHYEISNFCRSGFESKHNSSYWSGEHYLGVGPSAHSFNTHSRQWNISNNALYVQALNKATIPFEVEQLTTVQQLNEYIMTSIRTAKGLSLEKIVESWGNQRKITLSLAAVKYLQNGFMEEKNNFLQLTKKGKLAADGIAADLFFTDN